MFEWDGTTIQANALGSKVWRRSIDALEGAGVDGEAPGGVKQHHLPLRPSNPPCWAKFVGYLRRGLCVKKDVVSTNDVYTCSNRGLAQP